MSPYANMQILDESIMVFLCSSCCDGVGGDTKCMPLSKLCNSFLPGIKQLDEVWHITTSHGCQWRFGKFLVIWRQCLRMTKFRGEELNRDVMPLSLPLKAVISSKETSFYGLGISFNSRTPGPTLKLVTVLQGHFCPSLLIEALLVTSPPKKPFYSGSTFMDLFVSLYLPVK